MAESDHFYVSSDGDVLDQVIAGHYGSVDAELLATVLAYNPGLAALGAVLDAGTRILLPAIEEQPVVEAARLWD